MYLVRCSKMSCFIQEANIVRGREGYRETERQRGSDRPRQEKGEETKINKRTISIWPPLN